MGGTWVIWLIILVVSLVFEVATPQVISIWFAAGAFVALIFEFFGAPIWLQAGIFVLVSLLLIVFARPIIKKMLSKTPKISDINSDVGKLAELTEEIDPIKESGRVKIGDVSWAAVSADGKPIPAGSTVRILQVDGSKLIVERINNSDNNKG